MGSYTSQHSTTDRVSQLAAPEVSTEMPVILYGHDRGSEPMKTLGVGRYTGKDLQPVGGPGVEGNGVDSLVVADGFEVELFTKDGFRGKFKTFGPGFHRVYDRETGTSLSPLHDNVSAAIVRNRQQSQAASGTKMSAAGIMETAKENPIATAMIVGALGLGGYSLTVGDDDSNT
jgi:hypothetical protein